MTAIQFGGLASGLDTTAMIDALMGAQKLGLIRLQNTQAGYGTTKTAYDKLSTALQDFLAKSKAFTVLGAGSGRSATSSDLSAFTASAGTTATTGQYRISVDRLASATRAASMTAVGGAITSGSADAFMSTLPLAGTVTAGDVAIVVDGTIVHATIGAPGSTSLNAALKSIADAIQAKLNVTEPSATVTASIVGNKVEFSTTSTNVHSLLFGAGGQTSNALSVFGLAGESSSTFTNVADFVGTGSLGVVRSTVAVGAAGLTGLTTTTTGKVQINGVAISYDTAVDSLGTILSRINASTAGVTATIDRANDRIVLTNKTAGSSAIDIEDLVGTDGVQGTLAAALNLFPGTTTAQTIGQTAQITVDGQTYVSDTNHVTNAIDGVAIDLVDQTVGTRTLTVGVDRTKVVSALKDFITSFNALSDLLDAQTAVPLSKGATAGPLAGEAGLRGLTQSLRTLITGVASGMTGAIRSMGDIGVSTGPVGSAAKTTNRLILNEDALGKALDADPSRVADLLGASSGIMAPLVQRLTDITAKDGMIDTRLKGLASATTRIIAQENAYQDRLDQKQATLEAKFARLEATLAQLHNVSASLTASTDAAYKSTA